MRIAILGARGFLGRGLGRRLVADGLEVTGYILGSDQKQFDGIEYRSVTDLIESKSAFVSPFDIVINLAARRSTRAQPFTEDQVQNFTYEIPKGFIERTSGPNTLVINSSTYIQNFRGETGKTVDTYGDAKEKLSKFLEAASSAGRFTVNDLFFFTLYGPGDRTSHLVPLLLSAAKTGTPISLSPGNQLMNLLYIDDAIENILASIAQERKHSYTKNYVWSDEYFSVRELVTRIESTIGKEIDCDWGGREYVGHEMMDPWNIPMGRIPGFKCSTSFEVGITQTWKLFGAT